MVWPSPERRVQNHAEFVSIQTVNALAHNAQVAVRRIDTKHSLLEILGIDQFSRRAPCRELWCSEMRYDPIVHQDELTDDAFSGEPHQTACETGEVRNRA
jgi:hypothetical protein